LDTSYNNSVWSWQYPRLHIHYRLDLFCGRCDLYLFSGSAETKRTEHICM